MTVVIKPKKIMLNKLLGRKQMVVDVVHPKLANVSRNDVRNINNIIIMIYH
jgi:ribosomal protein S24E